MEDAPLVILASSFVGAVVGIALMVLARRGATSHPLRPYLAGAGLIALFWGPALVDRYLSRTAVTRRFTVGLTGGIGSGNRPSRARSRRTGSRSSMPMRSPWPHRAGGAAVPAIRAAFGRGHRRVRRARSRTHAQASRSRIPARASGSRRSSTR
jgi:hypothetical protein